MSYKFSIDRLDFYQTVFNNDITARTRRRLIEIAECGMEEVGIAEFGYKGIMSGLYIERVWHMEDEEFKDYMDWARGLIKEKENIF